MKFLKFTFLYFSIITQLLFAQNNFDINAYKQFLQQNQNLTPQQLFSRYDAGLFLKNIYVPPNVLYLDSIITKYNLTPYENSLLRKNGFVVTERLSYHSFADAFLDIWHKDLPVFITTDAILHGIHKSIDRILMDIELQKIIPLLKQNLPLIKSKLSELHNQYSSDSLMLISLKDVDVYLTVPMRLLGLNAQPFYSDNQNLVNTLINFINQQQPRYTYLFSSVPRDIDFSQFTPRGHYSISTFPELSNYFKTMMWFGRIELYLIESRSDNPYQPSIKDIQRQIIDALLIRELINLSNTRNKLDEIEKILQFFVGESDNVTLNNLDDLVTTLNITSPNQLTDINKVLIFQDSLKTKSYAFQRILSQILWSNPQNPDSIIPASAFLLFGQRFVVDSYITSQVVYDKIKFSGVKIRRMLPSTLDILFALGNSAAAQLLINELENYKYSSNLAYLRYIIDHYDNDFWESSIYNLWLNAIRALNAPQNRDNLPPFMKTAAFWQEKINTQLTSWTQLRHDFLLYAKQSYSAGVVCSYPYGYVEPIPEFYYRIKRLGEIAYQKFSSELILPPVANDVKDYFKRVQEIADTLYNISIKELNNQPLNNQEKLFLQKVLFEDRICGNELSGWYLDLFYFDIAGSIASETDYLVADIHTAPTDDAGNTVGWVKHCGTGKINLGVFIAPSYEGTIAYAGPLFSYHEFTTQNFLRLTDNLWKTTYLWQSTRPSFVNSYLADSTGNSRGEGINLFTGLKGENPSNPNTIYLFQNYPNPFNSNTIIGFSIPEKFSNSFVELKIYDIQGKEIKTLVSEQLQSGSYFVEWNGNDASKKSVSSGVYIYELRVGEISLSNKMILMK